MSWIVHCTGLYSLYIIIQLTFDFSFSFSSHISSLFYLSFLSGFVVSHQRFCQAHRSFIKSSRVLDVVIIYGPYFRPPFFITITIARIVRLKRFIDLRRSVTFGLLQVCRLPLYKSLTCVWLTFVIRCRE